MNQGLIPIVSEACGIDIDDWGFLVKPCTIENILSVVNRVASFEPALCRELSYQARRAALEIFSEESFSTGMSQAICEVVALRENGDSK
jgi:hypothetical protein